MRVHPTIFRSAGIYWQVPLIAILALASLIVGYLNGGHAPVDNSQRLAASTSKVLVLREDIESSIILSSDDFSFRTFDKAHLPKNYIRESDHLVGCETRGPIPKNYPLVPHFFFSKCFDTEIEIETVDDKASKDDEATQKKELG